MARFRIQLDSLSPLQAFEDSITAALASVTTFSSVDEATDFMLLNSLRGVSYFVLDGKGFVRAQGLCGGRVDYYPHPNEKKRAKNQRTKPLRLQTPTRKKAKALNSRPSSRLKTLHKKSPPKAKIKDQRK